MGKHPSANKKQPIVQLHIAGRKNSDIAKHLNFHRHTKRAVLKNWRNGNFITPKQRRKSRFSLTAQNVSDILNYFLGHPFNTYRQCICDLKLHVSAITVSRALPRNGIKNYVACYKQLLA